MRLILSYIGLSLVFTTQEAVSSFTPDDDMDYSSSPFTRPSGDVAVAPPNSPSLPIMRTGFDRFQSIEQVQRERIREQFQLAYQDFERRLISQAVQEVPTKANGFVERFNQKMETLPEEVHAIIPSHLKGLIGQEVFLVKSNGKGQESRVGISFARLINEYGAFTGREKANELSQKFGTLGFQLKDAEMIGFTRQEMHDLSASCFLNAARHAKSFAEDLNQISFLSDAFLSTAQAFYWAGVLSNDRLTQRKHLQEAGLMLSRANFYLEEADEGAKAELQKVGQTLQTKLDQAEKYLTLLGTREDLPSLYEWNKMISSLAIALSQAAR